MTTLKKTITTTNSIKLTKEDILSFLKGAGVRVDGKASVSFIGDDHGYDGCEPMPGYVQVSWSVTTETNG